MITGIIHGYCEISANRSETISELDLTAVMFRQFESHLLLNMDVNPKHSLCGCSLF